MKIPHQNCSISCTRGERVNWCWAATLLAVSCEAGWQSLHRNYSQGSLIRHTSSNSQWARQQGRHRSSIAGPSTRGDLCLLGQGQTARIPPATTCATSHTSHLTHLISHISSHSCHLTHLISHISSHTCHLTHVISHISSCTSHLAHLISHISSHTSHLAHLILHTVPGML